MSRSVNRRFARLLRGLRQRVQDVKAEAIQLLETAPPSAEELNRVIDLQARAAAVLFAMEQSYNNSVPDDPRIKAAAVALGRTPEAKTARHVDAAREGAAGFIEGCRSRRQFEPGDRVQFNVQAPPSVQGLTGTVLRRSPKTGTLVVELTTGRNAYKVGDEVSSSQAEVDLAG